MYTCMYFLPDHFSFKGANLSTIRAPPLLSATFHFSTAFHTSPSTTIPPGSDIQVDWFVLVPRLTLLHYLWSGRKCIHGMNIDIALKEHGSVDTDMNTSKDIQLSKFGQKRRSSSLSIFSSALPHSILCPSSVPLYGGRQRAPGQMLLQAEGPHTKDKDFGHYHGDS